MFTRLSKRLGNRRLAALGLALLLLGLLLASSRLPAWAQSGGCANGADDPDCVDLSNFDADADGWDYKVLPIWLAEFQPSWIDPVAYGVLEAPREASGPNVISQAMIKHTFLVPAGDYQVVARYTRVGRVFNSGGLSMEWAADDMGTNQVYCTGSGTWTGGFGIYTCGSFHVFAEQQIEITLLSGDDMYFDYIYLEQVTTSDPTPTHWHETPDEWGATPVPTNARATPQPTATLFCQPDPASTPAISQYQATATPTPASTFAVLDTFKYVYIWDVWQTAGDAVKISQAVNHDFDGQGATGNSLSVGFNGHDTALTTLATLSQALIMEYDFPQPVYIDGWAQAQSIPAGETGYIEVWYRDPVTGDWLRSSQTPISAQYWYPFHTEVMSTTAVAFVASRSDNPGESTGSIYLDDLYLYGSLSLRPYCGGSFPTTDINGDDVTNQPGTDVLWIPENKPCPGSIDRPNNFWGWLLSGMTFFMDSLFATTPYHTPGMLQVQVNNILLSPILGMFTFLAILFDWTIPLWVLGIIISIQVINNLFLIWKAIRRGTLQ